MTLDDESMYLISEFQLHQLQGYADLDFICQAIRARGPVSAASPALIQCKTCIFKGRRECIEHGYPDECIKSSCEFKIGKLAVVAPLEAQMRNREHDAAIERAAREKVLDELYSLAEDQIADANQMIQENSKEGMVDISSSKHGERDYWYGKGKFISASVFQMRIESLRNPTSEQPKED